MASEEWYDQWKGVKGPGAQLRTLIQTHNDVMEKRQMEEQDMWEVLPEQQGKDHEFGRILRESGWKGDTHTEGNTIEYLLPNGKVVAKGIFNNKECTYTAFINKGVAMS